MDMDVDMMEVGMLFVLNKPAKHFPIPTLTPPPLALLASPLGWGHVGCNTRQRCPVMCDVRCAALVVGAFNTGAVMGRDDDPQQPDQPIRGGRKSESPRPREALRSSAVQGGVDGGL